MFDKASNNNKNKILASNQAEDFIDYIKRGIFIDYEFGSVS